MCGRFSLTHEDWRILDDIYDGRDAGLLFTPRYNIAPAQESPVLYWDATEKRAVLGRLRWGLLPDSAFATINARAETLTERPAFKGLVTTNRCLVLADGYFEWEKSGPRGKRPHYARLKGHPVFAMAGLHAIRRRARTGEWQHTFTIITTEPNDAMRRIPHDRMPAILDKPGLRLWLDPGTDTTAALSLLRPYPADRMEIHPVSPIVNDWRNDVPGCIQPVSDAAIQPENGDRPPSTR